MDIARLGYQVDSSGMVTATKRMKQMEHQSGRVESAAMRMAKSLKSALGAFALMAATTFSMASMINEARAFNAALAEVSTLLPVVAGEIDVITDSSRRMSREFGGGAQKQAAAFYQAISAGAGSATQATKLLEVANRTAIGGVTDVATAVDVLTTAQNAYAESGLTAADAADTLFVGMRAGKTTVGELARALGRAIPQATAVGFSFSELVAATAALTTQGQTTAMAVTGLSGIMTQLLKPSSQALELAQQLGIEFSATKAATMGLSEFMAYLVEKTDGSQESLATLFGSVESLRAVFSLAGQGGVKFNEILGQMETRTGAADEAFKRVSESLDHRMSVAMARLGDIGLGIGTTMLEVLVPALERAADAAEFLADHMERLLAIGIVVATFFAVRYVTAVGIKMVQATMRAVAESIRLEMALGATSRTAALSSIAIKGFTLSLRVLRAAIVSTGIGVLVIAAGELIYRFMQLSDAAGGFGKALKLVGDVGLEVWDRMKLGAGALWEYFRAFTGGYVLLWQRALAEVLKIYTKATDEILKIIAQVAHATGNKLMANAVEATRAVLKATLAEATGAAEATIAAQERLVNEHRKNAEKMAADALLPLESIKKLTEVMDEARVQTMMDSLSPIAPGTMPITEEAGGSGSVAANDNADAITASQQFITSLQDELMQLTLTEQAYRRMQVEKAAAMAPTPEMAEQIRMLGEMREVTLDQADAEERMNAARMTLDDYQLHLDLMGMTNEERARTIAMAELERQGIVQGTEAWNQYGQAILDAAGNLALAQERTYSATQALHMMANGFGDIAATMRDSLGEQSAAYKAAFALQQTFTIASAALAMHEAMMKAMASGVTIWDRMANVAIVAQQAATIMSAIQGISLGFKQGGYTGNMGVNDIAGVVHGQEYVFDAAATQRIGVSNLDAMRRGVMPANDNGMGAGGIIELAINISVDDDGKLQAYVTNAKNEAVNAAVTISGQQTKARMNAAAQEAERPVISARTG